MLKKAWLASITLLFTISVLVISSQAAYAGQTPEMVLKCYDGLFAGNKLDIADDIAFTDMLQTSVAEPDEAQRVCVVALKQSQSPPLPPIIYWVEYEKVNGPITAFPDVKMQDQILGTYTGSLTYFEFLMSAEVNNNVVTTGDVDHPLVGYDVGFDVPPTIPDDDIIVTDTIHGTSAIKLDSFFNYQTVGIVDGAGTLVGMDFACYMILSEDPVFPGVTFNQPWIVKTKFGERNLNGLGDANVLCVKATKMVPTPPTPTTPKVGGEIIPIESTSLILAGAQSFSWMIPVILSGIGIGLFVVSRKSK